LSRKSDADVVREVTAVIDAAIEKNRRTERIVIVALLLFFLTGLGLLIFGAVIGRWEIFVPGGMVQLVIYFPIRRLIGLREDNMRLQILPQLMRLAETKEAKQLAAKLVQRLIEKV
jgi:hypothetical protein